MPFERTAPRTSNIKGKAESFQNPMEEAERPVAIKTLRSHVDRRAQELKGEPK
jgi:hypothetical protein